jgi:hypothetical protein
LRCRQPPKQIPSFIFIYGEPFAYWSFNLDGIAFFRAAESLGKSILFLYQKIHGAFIFRRGSYGEVRFSHPLFAEYRHLAGYETPDFLSV